ncbi:MAG: ATP-binding protein [Clostridia bacterium]|nr:ATP-binding protein [Clostridia bacterium]
MITKIQIKNINAIDSCDIDFQKNKYKYREEMIYNDKLVNPVAFYGTNGSGKSSFLEAISDLVVLFIADSKSFSRFSPNHLNLEDYINNLSKEKINSIKNSSIDIFDELSSSIKIFFELDGSEYEYFIETVLSGWITKEYLMMDNSLIFERELEHYNYKDKVGEIKKSLYPAIRKLATENQDDVDVVKSFEFLSNMSFIDATKRNFLFKDTIEKDSFDIIVEKSEEVNEILKEYKEFPLYKVYSEITKDGTKTYHTVIEAGKRQLRLPLSFISSGMMNQSLLLSVLVSLPENGVLFIDEIEDALHPLTVLDFIKAAQKKNIQLIFSSHNTFILQHLRPDQIFFANWKNGYSTYKKLSDIYPNIREINNIEKMYLANLFDEDIKNG